MNGPVRILIVEDLKTDFELAQRELRRSVGNCAFQQVETREGFLNSLETFQPDLILSDYNLPRFDGMEALTLSRTNAPLTPFIIWTGSQSEDVAVECMRAGANNYILKENLKRLGPAVVHALEEGRLLLERKQAEEKYQAIFENSPEGIFQSTLEGRYIKVNPAMARIYGYATPQEMIETVNDIARQIYVDPQDHEKFIRLFNTQSAVVNFEMRNRRKDGSIIWTATSARAVRNPGNKLLYFEGFSQDITERKLADVKLEENEQRLQVALQIVDLAVFNQDTDLRYTWIYQPQLDYNSGQVVGHTDADLLPPSDASHVMAIKQRVLETGLGAREEVSIHTPDKTLIYDLIVEPVITVTGTVMGLTGAMLDITGQKRAELERQAQLDIAQGLANLSDLPDFLQLIHHAVGQVIHAENFFAVFFNKETGLFEEIYSVDRYDPPAAPSRLEKSITSYVFRTGQPVLMDQSLFNQLSMRGEVELVGTDSAAWLGVPLKTPNGILGVIVVQDYENPKRYSERDKDFLAAIGSQAALAIERKQAEEQLRAQEKRFRSLIENGLDNISLLAADGTLLWENPAVNRTLGYAQDKFVNRNIFELMHPDDLGWTSDLFAKLAQEPGRQERGEFRLGHQDGTWRWIEATATNMLAEPSVNAIVINYRDVTERKQAEIELRQQSDDLGLLNAINAAVIRGESLGKIVNLLAKELRRIFSSDGSTIYMLDPDGKSLTMQQYFLAPEITRQIEKLIGSTIPLIQIPIREGGYFHRILRSGRATITSDPDEIQNWMTEFIETTFLPLVARNAARTLIPQIFNLLHLKSIIAVPLISHGKTIGILDVSGPSLFSEEDLRRIENFSGQLTAAIQRQQSDERVRRSEEFLQSIQNALSASIAILDKDGIIVQVNSAWRKFAEQNGLMHPNYGISLNYLEICDAATGPDAEEAPMVARAIREVLTGQRREFLIEYPCHGPEEKRWFTLRITKFEDGNHIWVVLAHENITERKRAELQLRKLSHAVEQSASTIVITDTAGNIEYVNPKFTEITGYTFEEVAGRNPRMLKSGHTTPEEYRRLWAAISAGTEWHGEFNNRKKNGELFWEQATISPIMNERGETTHYIAVKEDITERKQAEADIRRHLAELEALYENGLAVGRLLKPEEIGERVIATFANHLSWQHVTIRLRKEDNDELELIASHPVDVNGEMAERAEKQLAAHVSRVGQGLSGWVVQNGKPLRAGNLQEHPLYVNTHENMLSGLYMPLKIGERVIGVIGVESAAPEAFSAQDERLLATLANQAAIAFENARLYQTAQQELVERKRVEEALRTSEAHYRELADSITDIFFELDQELHYTHWNKASEMLTAVPAREAVGKSMHDIFGVSEEQTRIEQIYHAVLETHRPKTFETLLTINHQPRSFEINAYPSSRGVSVVAKDVTERKRTEILMQKRFELMEYAAGHSLPDLMRKALDEISAWTHSVIGFFQFVEEDQVTPGLQIWSTDTFRQFHTSESETMHKPANQAGVWAEAIHRRRAVIHNDYESLPGRKGLPSGHAPVIRELILPIIRNEKIVAVIGIGNKPQEYTRDDLEITERFADYAWDITERKQMELTLAEERNQLARRVEERTAELIHANSNLARALRVKDEFLANMSHELRTPLNAILGLSESLAEQIAGPLNEKQLKYITTISESGHHLLSLINDILDLAKIEAGQITLDINKVDVNSVCQASLRMIKQLAQKKNQEVLLQIEAGVGLMWADERRLKQMMVNLLSNAVKFTPEGGKLGLDIHGDQVGNKVMITVWDEGIGIHENDLARLFQPFVQLDAGLARESSGTGLGLALVAQMARLHGGSVIVTSEPGKGSRFTIELPWEPALALDSVERMKITGKFYGIRPGAKQRTILLIEDTQDVVMMLKDYLEMQGYKVVTAQDGLDGMTQAKLTHPDLILMDVQMPRMDGLEATQKLRQDPEFKHTPIIALTALAMPSDRERCLAAGMDEYISKPVNLRALAKIIQTCLSAGEEKTRPL